MSLALDTVEIRKKILALRRSQDAAARAQKSELIAERFWTALNPLFSFQGLKISAYRAMAEEVSLEALCVRMWKSGSELYFPSLADRKATEFDLLQADSQTLWKMGPLKIEEPISSQILNDPSALALIFVPGVAFSARGERIGMGAGHYDRFLVRNDSALRVSLAFDFQCCENIPQNHWDQPVDWVLTEKNDYRGPRWAEKTRTLADSVRKSSTRLK